MKKFTILATGMAAAGMAVTAGPAGASMAPGRPPLLPYIQIVKTANVQSFSVAGTVITYTYTVTNDGGEPLSNVQVEDPMPGLSAINCTPPGSGSTIADLAVGASAVCVASYTTTSADLSNGGVDNTGEAIGHEGPYTVINYSELFIPVANGPFDCADPTYFLAQFPSGGNGTSMWYSSGGTPSAPGTFSEYTGSAFSNGYNAIGYDPAGAGAGYIYGIDTTNNDLIMAGSSGNVIQETPISSLPSGFSGPVDGAFDASGTYYVSEGGGPGDLWAFNISNTGVATLASTTAITGTAFRPDDFAFSGGSMWGIDSTGYIYQMTTGGVVTRYPLSNYGIATDPGSYGAAWTFGNGDLGFSNNATGHILQIRVSWSGSPPVPSFTEIDQYDGPTQGWENDGTSCGTSVTDMEAALSGHTSVIAGRRTILQATVTNNGPGNSSGFLIKDVAKGGFIGLKAITPGCTADNKTHTVECVRGVQDNRDQFILTLSGKAPAAVGTCFTNTATVTGNETDPTPSNDTAVLKTCTTSSTHSTWTVKPGGTVNAKSGTVTLKDSKSGTVLTCQAATASGTIKKGSGLTGDGLGTVAALSFANCTGPLGLTFKVTPDALPWALNAATYGNGVMAGTLTGIDATLDGPSCTATLSGGASSGQASLTYTNSTGQLTMSGTGGNLVLLGVSGCFGLISNGDPVSVSAAYGLTPQQTITSP